MDKVFISTTDNLQCHNVYNDDTVTRRVHDGIHSSLNSHKSQQQCEWNQCCFNVGLRRRRWTSIKTKLSRWPVIEGIEVILCHDLWDTENIINQCLINVGTAWKTMDQNWTNIAFASRHVPLVAEKSHVKVKCTVTLYTSELQGQLL